MKWNNVLMLCGALVAAGCGSDAGGRIAVSGSVTYGGEPLADGRILLTPAEDNPGPSAGAVIEDGDYWISTAAGPGAGAYTITVTTGGIPDKSMFGQSDPRNRSSPLEDHETFEFERTIGADEGEAELNFDLTSAGSDLPR